MTAFTEKVIKLLQRLISIPSFSRQEAETADCIAEFLIEQGLTIRRKGFNVWVRSHHWQSDRPTLLLNSHHDTVKPVKGWQRDPFTPTIEGDRLYGLGSNDAGGPLMALLATFLHFEQNGGAAYNLIFAATAEEEISGPNGVASILEAIGPIDVAIVGEPTQLRMAVAERGLMVVDGMAKGVAGHAAREEGVNALYVALEDIAQLRRFPFDRESEWLGNTKLSITQISAGTQHNVVPDHCQFVIDVRTNDRYCNEEVLDLLQDQVQSELKARSFRLGSSSIALDHPLVERGSAMGLECFGSPTLSDQALLPFPSLKIGPGRSARSHTADEFIGISEIERGVECYVRLLKR